MSEQRANVRFSPLAPDAATASASARENHSAPQSTAGAFDLYGLYTHQERQEVLLRFFRSIGLTSLRGLKLLDIGCGSGGHLRRMVDFGGQPANCFGVDPCAKSIAAARELNPNISFFERSAHGLPFPDRSFDFAFQFTVFTSVLDPKLRRAIVGEVRRVLRPGGFFIWYDFVYSNPTNPNVRGIDRNEVQDLLQEFCLTFRRVTLAPPIGRTAVGIFPSLYWCLHAVPLLRSHLFCFAQKPDAQTAM